MAEEQTPLEKVEAEEAEEKEAQEAEATEKEEEEPEEESQTPDSSMVAEWRYESGPETLVVTFVNGHEESYSCSPEQWTAAKEASSAGKWMHQEML